MTRRGLGNHSVLNDKEITRLANEQDFINPFTSKNLREDPNRKWVKVLSYGVSSFGYDFTLADEIYQMDISNGQIIDVKDFRLDQNCKRLPIFSDYDKGKYVILPPHSFVLARTVEYVKMPEDVVGICFDKSTYARIGGVMTNTTVLEPGWEGTITLEIRNTLPAFCRLYVGEGIMQTIFFRGHRPEKTYADKSGKYQGQRTVTGAKV